MKLKHFAPLALILLAQLCLAEPERIRETQQYRERVRQLHDLSPPPPTKTDPADAKGTVSQAGRTQTNASTATETKGTGGPPRLVLQEDEENLTEYTYDPNRNRTGAKLFKPDGSLVGKKRYKLDGQRKIIEEVTLNADESLSHRTNYTYGKRGRVKRVRTFDTAGKPYRTTDLAYDKHGNLIRGKTLNDSGSLLQETRYTYDKRRNVNEKATYDADGTLQLKTRYRYDSNRRITEQSSFKVEGVLADKTLFTYDKRGNKTEEISRNMFDNLVYKKAYTYNKRNRKSSENYYDATGKITYRTRYRYDKRGNLLSVSRENVSADAKNK